MKCARLPHLWRRSTRHLPDANYPTTYRPIGFEADTFDRNNRKERKKKKKKKKKKKIPIGRKEWQHERKLVAARFPIRDIPIRRLLRPGFN